MTLSLKSFRLFVFYYSVWIYMQAVSRIMEKYVLCLQIVIWLQNSCRELCDVWKLYFYCLEMWDMMQTHFKVLCVHKCGTILMSYCWVSASWIYRFNEETEAISNKPELNSFYYDCFKRLYLKKMLQYASYF